MDMLLSAGPSGWWTNTARRGIGKTRLARIWTWLSVLLLLLGPGGLGSVFSAAAPAFAATNQPGQGAPAPADEQTTAPVTITIDGNMSDWTPVTTIFSDPKEVKSAGPEDLRKVWITNDATHLYVRWDVQLSSQQSSIKSAAFNIAADYMAATGALTPDGTPDSLGWVTFDAKGDPSVAIENPAGTNPRAMTDGSAMAAQSCPLSSPCVGTATNPAIASIEARFPFSSFGITTITADSRLAVWVQSRHSPMHNSAVVDRAPDQGAWYYDFKGNWTPGGTGPVLDVSKVASPSTVWTTSPNNIVTYTVTMKNVGTADATITQVSDTLPQGFTYRTGSSKWNDTPINDPAGTQTLVWSSFPTSTIAPEGAFVTLSFEVQASTTPGTYSNQVDVYATHTGSSPTVSIDPATTTVINPPASTTQMIVAEATGSYGGTTELRALLTSGGVGVSGRTISFSLNGTAVCGGATQPACPTTNSDGLATLSNASLAGIAAGTYAAGVGASFAGDASYTSSSGSNNLIVNPAPLMVTADAKSKVYGDADPALTYQITSGSLVGSDGLTGSLIRDAGELVAGSPYAIRQGTLTASSNYILTVVGASFTIYPKSVTGSFTAADKEYDGTTSATVLTRSLVGKVGNDQVELSGGTATFNDKNVGQNKAVTLTGATLVGNDAANYALTSVQPATGNITPKPVSGSFTANNKGYDGTTAATVASTALSGAIAGDNVSLTGGTASFDDQNVGENKTVTLTGASLTGTDAPNYSLTSVSTATANITAKGVTGSFTAANKVYDGDTQATITRHSLGSGVVDGDTVTLDGSSASAQFDTKEVGTGKTVTSSGFRLAGAQAANYSLSMNTTTADITPKPISGSFTAHSKGYDGTTAATVASTALSGVIAGDNVSLTGGTASFDDKNVGEGKTVTLAGAGLTGTQAGNYSLSSVNPTTANITAKVVTGSFTAADKVYDGTTSATITGHSLSGVVGTDQVSLTGGAATFGDKNVGQNKPVTGTGFALTGADAGNYSLNSVNPTTANITAKGVTGNFTVDNKVYDGNRNATITGSSLVAGGVVGSEMVGITHASATALFDAKDVGENRPVTGTGFALTGADAGNYSLAMNTTTASIAAKGVTGSFTAADKVYDGTTNATITGNSLGSGVVDGDSVTLDGSSASAQFDTKEVGTGKTVTSSGFRLAGTDAGNYSLSMNTTTANITTNTLTVSGITANDKVYDGNTSATLNSSNAALVGVVGTDDVTLNVDGALGSFADKNVASGKVVTVSGLTISGTGASNYMLSQPTTLANITAKSVTGNFTAADKVYDDNTDATITGSSLVAGGVADGDEVSLDESLATAQFDTKDVGTGKMVTSSGFRLAGAQAANYSLTMNTATANITAKSVTGSFTAANKIYDGSRDAIITGNSLVAGGVADGDEVSLDGSLATAQFDTKEVGTSKIVAASGFRLVGAQAANYSLSMNTATADITPKSISGSFTVNSKEYDGTTAATVASTALSGTIAGDNVSLTGGTASFDDQNVGQNKPVTGTGFVLGGADKHNYTLGTVSNPTASITARPITVTANAQSKTYGEADPVLTYRITSGSLAFSDAFTGGLTREAGEAVGEYDITQGELALSDNYDLRFVGAKLAIGQRAITVTADAQTKTYGGADPGLSYQVTSGELVTGDSFSGGLSRAAGENAGSYAIEQGTLTLNDNYTLTFVGANLTINKAVLTVTADNKSRTYGAANPVLTARYTGFVNGETQTSLRMTGMLTGSPSLTTTATSASSVGTYPIAAAVGTLSATNYSFVMVNGTLTVNKAPLTITAANQAKAYGAVNPTLTGTIVGLRNGDAITARYTTSASLSSPVGRYAIVPAAVDSTPSKLGNYTVSLVNGTLEVRPAPLTVTADTKSKLYGTPNPAFTVSYRGFVLGQDPRVLGGVLGFDTLATTSSNVGTYTVTPKGLTSRNYAISFRPGSLTIAAAGQTIAFGALGNQTYGNAPFQVSATASSGLGVRFSATGQCTVSGSTVTITGAGACTVTAAQDGNANYRPAASVAQTFGVAKAAAEVTLGGLSHTYDGTAKAATATTNPAGLNVTLAYSQNGTPVSAPITPGSYAVVATVHDANYAGSASSTLVIHQAPESPAKTGRIMLPLVGRH